MTHNIHHISELPPLYRAERKEIAQRAILAKEPDCRGGRGGFRGEYKKAKMKRCV
jgi:hypothetical protein